MTIANTGSSRTVGEVELNEAIQVMASSSVLDACKAMAERNGECVLVVDTSGAYGARPEVLSRPEILGILTVKDVVNRVMAKGKDPAYTKVSDVMTKPVHSVDVSTTLYKVAYLINQNDFRQIPVVDKYAIKGIVTSRIINMAIIKDIVEEIKLVVTIFR